MTTLTYPKHQGLDPKTSRSKLKIKVTKKAKICTNQTQPTHKRIAKFFYDDNFTNGLLPDNPTDKLYQLKQLGWQAKYEFNELFITKVLLAKNKFNMHEGDLFYSGSGSSGRIEYNIYMLLDGNYHAFGEDLYNLRYESDVIKALEQISDKADYVHLLRNRLFNGLGDFYPFWESDMYPNGPLDMKYKTMTFDAFEKALIIDEQILYQTIGTNETDIKRIVNPDLNLYIGWRDSAKELKETLKQMGCSKLSGNKTTLQKRIREYVVKNKIFRHETESLWTKDSLYGFKLTYKEIDGLRE